MKPIPCLLISLSPLLAQTPSVEEVLSLACTRSPSLAVALDKSLKADDVRAGTAYLAKGPDFLFVVEAASEPALRINDEPGPRMAKLDGSSDRWVASAKLPASRTHNFHYLIGGKPFGGRNDVMAYGEYHYLKPGVPEGKLTSKMSHTSRIYDGMAADYWVYVPAQYRPGVPIAVMFWTDGEVHINRDSGSRAMNVWDNLTYEKKIPAMLQVLVSPGTKDGQRWRSIQYDSVDDRFARYVLEEILPEVGKAYSLRSDGYSRAIAGDSSGAICALNAAWWRPEEFSRVLLRIGQLHQYPVAAARQRRAYRQRRRPHFPLLDPQIAAQEHSCLYAGRLWRFRE